MMNLAKQLCTGFSSKGSEKCVNFNKKRLNFVFFSNFCIDFSVSLHFLDDASIQKAPADEFIEIFTTDSKLLLQFLEHMIEVNEQNFLNFGTF